MKRISLVLVAAAAACWLAPGGVAATFKGTVVGRDGARAAIAVASPRGAVHTIRVAHLRNVGARVSVAATRRPDGTFRASHVSVSGRAGHARIHGVVVRRTSSTAFLSAGGTVLAVRGAKAVRPGRVVTVDVSIHHGGLRSAKIVAAGSAAFIKVEGTVASLSPLKIELEHGGATIQLTVPAALTLPAGLAMGDEVEAIVEFENGVYTLVTLERDDEAQQNDDDDDQGEVEVRGVVTAVGGGSLTVKTRHGDMVMFVVPAGFDLTGIAVGTQVEAEGVRHDTTLTLTKVKVEDDEDDDDHGGDDGHGGHDGHGGGGGGDDD